MAGGGVGYDNRPLVEYFANRYGRCRASEAHIYARRWLPATTGKKKTRTNPKKKKKKKTGTTKVPLKGPTKTKRNESKQDHRTTPDRILVLKIKKTR